MKATDRQRLNIITATLGLIEARGFSALSLSDIATAAGVSRQTVYNHFPDSGAVVEAALEMHAAAMLDILSEQMGKVSAPRDKLVALARFMVDSADPAHDTLSLEAALSAEARARLERHNEALRARIAEALSPNDPIKADLIWSILEAAAKTAARHPEQKPALLHLLTRALDAIL